MTNSAFHRPGGATVEASLEFGGRFRPQFDRTQQTPRFCVYAETILGGEIE